MATMSLWQYGAIFHEHERRQRQAAAASNGGGRGPGSMAADVPDDWTPTEHDFAQMRANIARMGMSDVRV